VDGIAKVLLGGVEQAADAQDSEGVLKRNFN